MATGALFNSFYLDTGIADLPTHQALTPARLDAARATLAPLLQSFHARANPNEAETERDLIDPILALLGWTDFLPQQTATKRRADVPDYLLFADAPAKAAATALALGPSRYARGAAICENKRWALPLDSAEPGGDGAPSTQIVNYLRALDLDPAVPIRFGLLTNGRCWRLYDGAPASAARLDAFLEIDLDAAARDPAILARFLALFSREAVADGHLLAAVAANGAYQARVTTDLSRTVFTRVFPDLLDALHRAAGRPAFTPAHAQALRDAGLAWLYRLLFTLYAEDRDLLPTRAHPDGLARLRDRAADAIDARTPLSTSRTTTDDHLRALWRQIDGGDDALGIPPYNGGLFAPARAPLLEAVRLPDADAAPLLDALSREGAAGHFRRINFRDLGVRHLGAVYEGLLEYEPYDAGAAIKLRPQAFARKTSGSYYTPDDLVGLVIRRTLAPLLAERREAFAAALAAGADSAALAAADPASAFLDLRIVDPAMGSGHFLVALTDYLADEALSATAAATQAAAAHGVAYASPLLERLAAMRDAIRAQAAANGWRVHDAHLIDRALVKRIVLKRVIHGVDKNPMAVELAKLSLWLHSFTVGAPLSFLDHHLRCGDSLFGEWALDAIKSLDRGGLGRAASIARIEADLRSLARPDDLADASLSEVHESAARFAEQQRVAAPAIRIFNLLHGYRWIAPDVEAARREAKKLDKASFAAKPADAMAIRQRAAELKRKATALNALLDGDFGDPLVATDYCYGRIGTPPDPATGDDPALVPLVKAAGIARISNFLPWELAFPWIWTDWFSPSRRSGGFDAVIGNPPWDRLKLQQVEWFAARRPDIAAATTAAARNRLATKLVKDGDPLAGDFARAAEMASYAAGMAGRDRADGGQYPLLGGGDVNLYSLFVERAAALVKPEGVVGLLTPSGIAGDKGAADFFRSVSTTGRLGALLDWENRGEFFPDVHRSFKFCLLVFGGPARAFPQAQCGFFLPSAAEEAIAERAFPLTPAFFAAVNPNTGTAPVVRTPKDAELLGRIYARVPCWSIAAPPPPSAPGRSSIAACST